MKVVALPLLVAAGGAASADQIRARWQEMRALPQAELAELLRATSPEELIALGREGVRSLGTYRTRVTKQERIDGRLLPPQTIDVIVQSSSPRALRLEYVAGPRSGRRVLWRENRRPSEMLVREGGILGLTSLWIDTGGRLARRDTNHRVTELGFGPLLDLLERDLRTGRPQGGHARRDLGFDARGRYCMEYTAPPGARGLYAQRARMCLDPRLFFPVQIEVYDSQGLLERYEYADVRPNQRIEPSLLDTV